MAAIPLQCMSQDKGFTEQEIYSFFYAVNPKSAGCCNYGYIIPEYPVYFNEQIIVIDSILAFRPFLKAR